jgi:hypothetical protein
MLEKLFIYSKIERRRKIPIPEEETAHKRYPPLEVFTIEREQKSKLSKWISLFYRKARFSIKFNKIKFDSA